MFLIILSLLLNILQRGREIERERLDELSYSKEAQYLDLTFGWFFALGYGPYF